MSVEYGGFPNNEPKLLRLAALQHGVLSRDQARAHGFSESMIDRRIRSGRWVRLHPGVYGLVGSSASWRKDLMAATLAAGPAAAASHRSAAGLWRFPQFEPGIVEIIIVGSGLHSRPHLIVHRASLSRIDRTKLDGIPVTSATRTLFDIAAVLPDKLEVALDDGLRRNLTSLALLRRRMTALGRRPGTTLLRKFIDERDGMSAIPQTVFETHLFRFIMDGGFPRPVCQYPVHKDGRLFAVLDFAYPELMIGIEADGYVGHSGPRQWKHDHRRRAGLTHLGWTMIHVIWEDLWDHPDMVAQRIADAIAQSCHF